MKLAIILVNFNNNYDTVKCVRSIHRSRIDTAPFVIVIDNGSIDKSLDLQLDFYPSLKVILLENNVGFAAANNIGYRWLQQNVNPELVLVLNNDTVVLPDSIQILINSCIANQEFTIFSPKILTMDDNPRIWYAGGSINLKRLTPSIRFIDLPDVSLKTNDYPTEFVSGCAFLINMKKYSEISIFDERFFMYDEDVDFSIRMVMSEKRMYYVSMATILHKCQGSQTDKSEGPINQLSYKNPNLIFYLRNTIGNRYYIARRHYSGLLMTKILIDLTIYWILKAIQFTLVGRPDYSWFIVKELSILLLVSHKREKNKEKSRN